MSDTVWRVGPRWLRLGLVLTLAPFVTHTHAQPIERRDEAGQNSLQEAVLATRSDIARDTEELNEFRARMAAQRHPLASRLEVLQTTVRQQRIDIERLRRIRNQRETEQAEQASETEAMEEEFRFLTALFVEYARAMETRGGAAEGERLVESLRPIQNALTKNALDEHRVEAIGDLLALSADWNDQLFGGDLFEGVALNRDGIEQTGRFAVLGPITYFAAYDEGPAGLAVTQFGVAPPAIYARFPAHSALAIRTLVDGGAARVPVDVTGGDAIKVADVKPTVLEHFRQGGFVMIPLMVVALAALVLVIWKAIELGGIQSQPGTQWGAVMDALRKGDSTAARQAAECLKQPLRSLVEEAVAHRNAPREHIEEILHEQVLSSLPRLERHLGTLAVLGGIAPLLGLLGTVTGMIHTFQLVTIFGSGDAKLLSGGISEALVTTETGLVIAIPVLVAHAFLARRARSILGALERSAVGIVNEIKVRAVNE